MTITERPRAGSSGVGYLAAAAIAAWVIFALVDTLEPNGRHLLVLGALRIVLFALLLSFVAVAKVQSSRAARVCLAVAGLGAAVNLLGGLGAVVTDGWSYNPFTDGTEAAAPWYAFLVLVGAMLFALGTVVTGIVGRSAGWLAVAVVLGGVLYAAAIPLGAAGHLVWVAPWFAISLGLATRGAETRSAVRA